MPRSTRSGSRSGRPTSSADPLSTGSARCSTWATTWLADLVFSTLGVSFSIEQLIVNALLDTPIYKLGDPIEVLPAEGVLAPVRLPFQFLGARVDATELIVEADVEAPA